MINQKLCQKCFYSVQLSGGKSHVYCDYITKVGMMRPKGGKGMHCPGFDPKKKPTANRNVFDYIFLSNKGEP